MELSQKIGRGDQADVYLDSGCAVKVFHPGYSKAKVYYEAMITSLVEETGLPIAKIHGVFEDEGSLAIQMDYLPGVSLNSLILKQDSSFDFYVQQMVALQKKVHAAKTELPFWLKDVLGEKIEKSPVLHGVQKNALMKKLDELPEGAALCHGDFHGANIICGGGRHWIIDWIDATLGCAQADACRTYMLYSFYAPDVAQRYLDRYCSDCGCDKRDVLQWLSVIAAARLSDGNAREYDKIRAWIGPV